MPPETIVVLKTLPQFLPLYWTAWTMDAVWPFSAKAVCRLLMPEHEAQRQRLLEVYLRGEVVACLLKDSTTRRWYAFDAYLTMVDCRAELEVTLVSLGEVREAADMPVLKTA